MRVTGLANGIYDVYVVAGYIGSSTTRRPGAGSDVAHQGVWIFTGTTANLAYNGGTLTGGGATAVAPSQVLENSVNSVWTENVNYEVLRVTISNTNPTLYVAASGAAAVVGNTSAEDRPWLNLVQVVAVPEPSSAMLALGAIGSLALRRRR